MTARRLHRVEALWGTPPQAPASADLSWRDEARCAQSDPEGWFPEKGHSTAYAKKVCRGCPVTAECLEFALENDERYGVWGGLSERERRRISKPDRIEIPAGHQQCTKCEEVKPLTAFHRNSETKTGRTGKCASCRNAEDAQRTRTRVKEAA